MIVLTSPKIPYFARPTAPYRDQLVIGRTYMCIEHVSLHVHVAAPRLDYFPMRCVDIDEEDIREAGDISVWEPDDHIMKPIYIADGDISEEGEPLEFMTYIDFNMPA